MKYIAGIVVFLLAGTVVFIALFAWGLFERLPSREAVLNFVTDTAELPLNVEGVPSSALPLGGDERPIANATATVAADQTPPKASTTSDWLTPSQRTMLRTLGVEESELPTVLTPELEACFVEAIGATRVAEIKAGDIPTLFEGMKAVACL